MMDIKTTQPRLGIRQDTYSRQEIRYKSGSGEPCQLGNHILTAGEDDERFVPSTHQNHLLIIWLATQHMTQAMTMTTAPLANCDQMVEVTSLVGTIWKTTVLDTANDKTH